MEWRRRRTKVIHNECRRGRVGRKMATHNSPPERPCCCYGRRWRRRRKEADRTAAVSLVTGGRDGGRGDNEEKR